MAAPSPNKRRRRHHRPFFLSSPTTPRRLLSLAASTLLLLCCCFSPFHRGVGVEAKEIVATSEWTLLGENDTIPAGLHVRMDMTTGEKWVKLMDDEEDGKEGEKKETHWSNSKDRLKGQGTVDVEVGADGATVYSSAVSVTPTDEETTNESAQHKNEPKVEQQHTEPKNREEEVEYDYEMMHRTLSSLPPDEKERMGGLPELPAADPMSAKVTPEQRALFEERMKEIWTQRQLELKEWQENYMADLPEVLKERIKVLESYVQNPTVHIQNLMSSEGGRNDANEEEDGGDAAVATDIVSVLQDLEYHLSDVDMARDFHTLGGWTLLVSLLSDSVHVPPMIDKQQNETADIGLNERSKMDIIQANAAWAIGTAVKNHDEFHSWSLDDYSDALVTTTSSTENGEMSQPPPPAVTAVTLIVDHFRTIVVDAASSTPSTDTPKTTAEAWNKRQKYLYALGSILRGNRLAQRHFLDVNGPSVLANLLSNFAQPQSGAGPLTRQEQKFISKTLALADDVITDVTLHPSTTTAGADDDGRTFDTAIVKSFTTKVWSNAVLQLLTNNNSNRVVREATLRTILAMVPYCDTWGDIDVTKKAIIQARNNVGMDEDMDMEHKIEVLEIADSILKGLA